LGCILYATKEATDFVEGRLEKQFFAKKGRKLLQATCSLIKSFSMRHIKI